MTEFLGDILKYGSVRVMPQRVQKIAKVEDSGPIIFMEYCEPERASSWIVEGVIPADPVTLEGEENYKQFEEVDQICECSDQFTAYFIMDLLVRELEYQQGERKLQLLQERRRSQPEARLN